MEYVEFMAYKHVHEHNNQHKPVDIPISLNAPLQ